MLAGAGCCATGDGDVDFPWNCVQPKYSPAATTTAAATPIRAFLLPPSVDSGVLAPPNVKVGAGAEESGTWPPALPSSTVFAAAADSLSGAGCSNAGSGATRAGAGALAAPVAPAGAPIPVGGESKGLTPADGERVLGNGCGGAVLNAGGATGVAVGTAGTSVSVSISRTSSVGSGIFAVGAGLTVLAVAAWTGLGAAGAAGFVTGAGIVGRGFAGVAAAGLGAAGADAVGAAVAGFAGSPLRSNPRATRSVPLACSTLIGLVSTRFAPMRNAFATPACPSTTATASDVWLDVELRALLNKSVAFCSLSQSTTMASKCSAINFLTAAKGSLQDSTENSSSLSADFLPSSL